MIIWTPSFLVSGWTLGGAERRAAKAAPAQPEPRGHAHTRTSPEGRATSRRASDGKRRTEDADHRALGEDGQLLNHTSSSDEGR